MTTNKYDKIKQNLKNFKWEVFFNGGYSNIINPFLTLQEEKELKKEFDKFLDNEIKGLFNSEVEYILKKSYEDKDTPFNYDDVENLTTLRQDDLINDMLEILQDMEKDDLNDLFKQVNKEYNLKIKKIGDFEVFLNQNKNDLQIITEDYFNTLDFWDYEEQQEVYQWFSVSDWLENKLSEKGEVIIKNCNYWGRSCFGQSISMDKVLQEIFLEQFIKN